MEKVIYIPGFWNFEDEILKNRFKNYEKYVLQYNLREVEINKLRHYLSKSSALQKILSKYDFSKIKSEDLIKYMNDFKGFTRTIKSTIQLTSKRMAKLLENNWFFILAWHSQGWLILIETILNNPNLLNNIRKIELLAPVISYELGYSFHKWIDRSYFLPYWKNVIVTDKYIKELETNKKTNDFESFLKLLKEKNWNWKIELVLWEKDNVIPLNVFDIGKITKIFPDIQVKIVKGADHYLGYR